MPDLGSRTRSASGGRARCVADGDCSPSAKLRASVVHRPGTGTDAVQTFVTQPPVEAFYVAVFSRLSWPDEVELYAALPSPFLQRFGGELRAVIDGDRCWRAVTCHSTFQTLGDRLAGEPETWLQ